MVTDFTPSHRGGARVLKTLSIKPAWLNDTKPDIGGQSTRESGYQPSNHESPDRGTSLGRVIRNRRRELGMTQQDLATLVNRSGDDMRQSDVSRLERGQVSLPRSQRLQHIAEALNMSSGELLARGGWSGAESSFLDEADAETTNQVQVVVGRSLPTVGTAHVCPGATDSLAARTEQLLQRCRDEREMVRRILSGDGDQRRLTRAR